MPVTITHSLPSVSCPCHWTRHVPNQHAMPRVIVPFVYPTPYPTAVSAIPSHSAHIIQFTFRIRHLPQRFFLLTLFSMSPPFLLLFLLLSSFSLSLSPPYPRLETTFNLIYPVSSSLPCPTSITHLSIAKYNFNTDAVPLPSQPVIAVLFSNLLVNSLTCVSSPPFTTTTFSTPIPVPSPFFLTARDLSPRNCPPYVAEYPSHYEFLLDFELHRSQLEQLNLVPSPLPSPLSSPKSSDLFMYSRFFHPDSKIPIAGYCLYLAIPPSPSPTPPPSPTPEPVCFPPHVRVPTPSGSTPMRLLKEGMVVRTGSGWEQIIAVTHADANKKAWFVGLDVKWRNGNSSVWATEGHLVETQGIGMKRMQDVQIGDKVMTENGWGNVINKRGEWGSGVYSVVTDGGDIVVESVVMSCYMDWSGVGVAHGLLTAIRWMRRMVDMEGWGLWIQKGRALTSCVRWMSDVV